MTTLLMATADVPMDRGNWLESTGYVRTGSKSFYNALNYSMRFPFSALTSSPVYWRTCFMHQAGDTSAYAVHGVIQDAAAASILTFLGNGAKGVEIRQGSSTGTVLHTIANGVVSGVWQVLEIYLTTTTCTVRLNGIEEYAGTSLTFDLTDMATVLYGHTGAVFKGYLDDIVVCTDAWPGLGGLHVFTPGAASTPADWDSALPTLSTPGDTAGTAHKFTLPDAPAGTVGITRAGVFASASVDDVGYGGLKLSHNTTVDSNAKGLSISPREVWSFLPSSLTISEFNALTIGVQSG